MTVDPLSAGTPVLVAGGGLTGRSVLAACRTLAITATLCDDDPATRARHADAGVSAASPSTAAAHITDYALVVTSPGFRPTAPVLAAAAAAGVPIWGDVELAWRLDRAGYYGRRRRWLTVTGTNGKTTTTSMLHAMLTAAGLTAQLCGNIGSPVLDALREPAELLVVEVSSFQLYWAPSLRPEAGVVLNIAEDHLDWHGSMDNYTAAKARVLGGRVAVAGLDDARAAALLGGSAASVRVGFRLGQPAPGELGVRDGMLVDRAFADGLRSGGLVLAAVSSIPVPPIGVLDALAAAAMARCIGVGARWIADALASF
jgi:UDP-N-acetylmuramoylalanine--D-glutamate ligase